MDMADNQLHITTETAWDPMLKMWQKVVDKYLPGAEIIYAAEEPGMCLYVTNDPTFDGHYNIYSWDEPYVENEYCADEQTTIKALQKYLKSDKNNIDELLKDYEDLNPGDVCICKWEMYPLDYWD